MNRQVKQVLGLSAFAAGCMALGMGLSHGWQVAAQEEKPVVVDAKGLGRHHPSAAEPHAERHAPGREDRQPKNLFDLTIHETPH